MNMLFDFTEMDDYEYDIYINRKKMKKHLKESASENYEMEDIENGNL